MFLLGGCSTRIADLTVASSKNMDLNRGNFVRGKRVEGSSIVPVIIVPFGTANLKEAIDNAIEREPCAVGLSNAVIYRSNYTFAFGYRVIGDLIIDRGINGCNLHKTDKNNDNKNVKDEGSWY